MCMKMGGVIFMAEINIILGPPGTGKTENLLRIVDRELKNRTAGPDSIGFFSFTQKAANEARDRAKTKFNLTDDDLPYFRTLHSFGKGQLGITNSEVMKKADYKKFGDDYGIDFDFVNEDPENGIVTTDNPFLREINLSRVKCLELQKHYDQQNLNFGWYELLRAYQSLVEYKHKNSKSDFTDMLSEYVAHGPTPKFDVVMIDEAQDLSKLQWEVCEKIFRNTKKVYISGDDDQAIFRWAGADIEHLINMKGNKSVLNQSYRCPKLVHNVADEIVHRIGNRLPKDWRARDHEGKLKFHSYPEAVDVREGNWLILATCKYMFQEMEQDLRVQGLPYKKNNKLPIEKELLNAVDSWNRLHKAENISYKDVSDMYSYLPSKTAIARGHKSLQSFIEGEDTYNIEDLVNNHGLLLTNVPWQQAFEKMGDTNKEYIKALEKFNPNNLTADPKIHLSTIHVAKGGECDNVMLMTDLSLANQEEMEKNSDDTNRVFYVGATRAKEELHIVQPQRGGGFIL